MNIWLTLLLVITFQTNVVALVGPQPSPPARVVTQVLEIQEGRRGRLRSQQDLSLDFKVLYEAHEWMKLKAAVKGSKAPAFYQGAVAAVFNDAAVAEKYLNQAIKSSPNSEQVSDAYSLLTQTYIRNGQYSRAVSAIDEGLKLKPNDIGLKNARALFGALAKIPEQTVITHGFSKIQYTLRDGNLFVPVQLNETPVKGLVDTGANFSLISFSEAKRLGLAIRDANGATMGDSAGADVAFQIAEADSLIIGKVKLRHVIFFVMRDDQQPFVELPEGERMIIGFPVLFALQAFGWDRSGNFEIGLAQERRSPSNIWFEGSEVVFQGQFNNSKIGIFLDTGATRTRVLSRFAKEFPSVVDAYGIKSKDRVTGVGSSVEVDSMTLPELKFRISASEVILRQAKVLVKDTASNNDWYHVWIGMDLLKQPRRVSVDFRSMSVKAE